MSNRDWLSLAEIARLWSEECGESADDLERDLDSWFTEFVARAPSQRPQRLVSPGRDGDNTNRLMGMLGGRHLERQTLEAYCEERGRPKPRFWFDGRVETPQGETPQGETPQCETPQRETPQRDATRQTEPAAGEPEAGSEQSGAEPPSLGPARDPDLESFQTQIADMSDRLNAPGIEYSSLEQASAERQTDSASQTGEAAPSMDRDERELIARAEVASAKARELKMQLEAAEKRITDLAAAEAARHEAKPSARFERPAAAGYRDPNVTIQLLQHGTRRGGRARTLLLAGLAIPVAALALWGGVTVIQLASDRPIPPPALSSPAEQALPDIVSQAYEPPAERPGLGGEELGRPSEPWSASATKPTTAELTAARQRLENALEKAAPSKSGAEAGPSRKELVLAIEIARAQAAIYKQDLAAALERLAQSEADMQTANARTDILTKALIDTRRRHSAAVEVADADDNSARRQLARDAMVASDQAASLEQDLSAARRRISGLKAQLGTARTETASLTKQLAQLRKEHAALLEIFRAQSHQGTR